MKRMEITRTILASAGAVLLAATGAQAGWPGDAAPCRADMVKAGAACIDKYEASAWLVPNPTTTNKGLVRKIVKGKATRVRGVPMPLLELRGEVRTLILGKRVKSRSGNSPRAERCAFSGR